VLRKTYNLSSCSTGTEVQLNFIIHYKIEKAGHQVAVIYGGLPPNTKLAMAAKFNDPNDPCNILVASDAIGMGILFILNFYIFAHNYRIEFEHPTHNI
jgi:superfamily II DNA/RNA helicase